MAETQKKKSGGKRTASAAAKRSGSRQNSHPTSSGRSRTRPAEPRPVRRGVGGTVCLLLAVFCIFGVLNIKAIFIDLLCNTAKGIIGYGFWLLAPALVVCAWILFVHRGRPVVSHLVGALLVPVLFGSLLHLFLSKESFPWGLSMVRPLWEQGEALQGGGVVSGMLAQGLSSLFSKWGALLILLLAILIMIMLALRITPMQVIQFFHSHPRAEYDEEDYRQQEQERLREKESRRSERDAARDAERAADIVRQTAPAPVRMEPEDSISQPDIAPETVKKRSFFNRKPRVPSPDQILAGVEAETRQEEGKTAPSAEAVQAAPIPSAGSAGEMESAQIVSPEPVPDTTAVLPDPPVPPAVVPRPVPPVASVEIQREPAVTKVKKGETEQAAAEVAQDIARSMEAEPHNYIYPPVSLLTEAKSVSGTDVASELKANQNRLSETIRSFGIDASIVHVTRGPSVTRYEVELDQGVRLNKLTNLSDDIALALGASGVRIAPIPDKISMVGIEVPNKLVTPVPIREVIDSREFREHPSKVSFAVGKDIGGKCIVGNIAKLPHLLIAGTTGSGKSVCTNSLIISLLYKATPEEVRLIMVDPKMVELGIYNGIPHLLIPVVTDPKKAAGALQWAVVEMMKRYRAFSEMGVRDLASYNSHVARILADDPERAEEEKLSKMPQIVVVIDELADLMLVAAKEVEESICRVAQMGRAAGMHLIIATQRPSADVITGLMKANIPSRIAFAVASSLESRIILDTSGAEKLVGRGDMLYFPLGTGKPRRVQGCLISDEEVADVVGFIKENSADAQYDDAVMQDIEKRAAERDKGAKGSSSAAPDSGDSSDYDELLPNAIEVVVESGMASVSMLQRRLKLGYSRAARLVDQMEEKGVVGPFEGSKPRQVLISKDQWQEMQFRQDMNETASAPEPVPEELEFEGDAIPQGREAPFDLDDN